MKNIIQWFQSKKNGKIHDAIPVIPLVKNNEIDPVLKPRVEDDFSLGAKAIALRQSEHWETVRMFCALKAEQEIISATDAPNHAAACCQRAAAILDLTGFIDDAISRREQLMRAQEDERQRLNAELSEAAQESPAPKTSQRWTARGTSRLA